MRSFESIFVSFMVHRSLFVGGLANAFLHMPTAVKSGEYRRHEPVDTVKRRFSLESPLDLDSRNISCGAALNCIEYQSRLVDKEEIERAERAHGMPWRTSVSSTDDTNLYYMQFWEWQLRYIKENLTNLRLVECTSKGSTQFPASKNKFDFKEGEETTSRVVSLCFSSDEYRKIRMTYYENGQIGQSFNTMWYPDSSYNLPILGVNLLSKSNLNKHLAIIDFQPLHEKEDQHAASFSHLQQAILQRHPQLDADQNDRIWDLQVFSKQMLCKRFKQEEMVTEHVFPAFCEHVESHIKLVQATAPDPSPEKRRAVMKRHVAYDTYSAVRDPCTALLGSLFGKEWADEFVFGFLYSLSERKKEDYWEKKITDTND